LKTIVTSIVRSVSADALLGDETSTALTSIFLRDGDSRLLRLFSRGLAQVGLHFRNYEETGTARPYLCIGDGKCAACLGGRRPTTTFMLPGVYVPTRSLGVISFGEASGPDSLRRLIGQHLRLPDYGQKLVELALHRRKYSLKILRTITEAEDGEEYGLDILGEVVERGGVTADEMAATIDRLTNAEMIDESVSLRNEIALRLPGLDVTTL
jgi:hypothetical protein